LSSFRVRLLGSLVEVLGPHQALEDLARDAGTISYEILTGFGDRYHRQYRYEPQAHTLGTL